MGLFEKIFRKPRSQAADGFFKTFSAYAPVFTSFAGSIYESELVRASVHTIAEHTSKLGVTVAGNGRPKLQHRLNQGPNDFQTWSQFMYRLRTILEVQNTAFICPVFDDFGEVTGVYSLLPSRCSIVEYDGEPFLRYKFSNGKTAAVELRLCGIVTKFQYKDDFFGESNTALMPTMQLVTMQNQGIEEGVKSSATFRFMAKMTNWAMSEDIAKEQRDITAAHMAAENGGGVVLFPNTWADIKQIQSTPFVVDAKQMEVIQQNVYTYFGVNVDVLQNKAYGDSWGAFYEGKIEPFAIQLSEVLTKMLFSERERALGNRVIVSANRLLYMSTKEKIEFVTQMGDRGCILIDEARAIFQMAPLPDKAGQVVPIRGEYHFVDDGKKDDNNNEGGKKNE